LDISKNGICIPKKISLDRSGPVIALASLLIGGEGLGRNYRNSIGRASTPYAFLELGFYGNIGMHVSLMG